MRIYFKVVCKYMSLDGRTSNTIPPGTYDVPKQIDAVTAKLVLKMGRAVIVPEPKVIPKKPRFSKKAPENKVLKAKESK
jgi:hypothetical protein